MRTCTWCGDKIDGPHGRVVDVTGKVHYFHESCNEEADKFMGRRDKD